MPSLYSVTWKDRDFSLLGTRKIFIKFIWYILYNIASDFSGPREGEWGAEAEETRPCQIFWLLLSLFLLWAEWSEPECDGQGKTRSCHLLIWNHRIVVFIGFSEKKLSHKFLKKDWCFLNHQCMVRSEFPWVECTGAWFIWGWLKEIWNLPTHISSCSVLYKVFFSCVCLISFTVSVLLMFSSSAISHDTNFVTFALHHGLQIINKYPRHVSYV